MIPVSGYSPSYFNQQYYLSGGDVGGYDYYNENSASSETAIQLAQQFINRMQANGINLTGKKVLDVGCGYGFLVKYLVSQGVDAYGMDFSSWAISQASTGISGRLITGSSIDASAWDSARALAGFTKKQDKFDLIIDQDMIVCLTDAQALTFETLAKANTNFLVHYLESYNPHISGWYNYKTLAEWKSFIGNDPKEKWYSRFYWLET